MTAAAIFAQQGRVRWLRPRDTGWVDLLTTWLRNGLLPAAAILVGGGLLVRVARWIEGRYRVGMDEQLAAVREEADDASEQLKRSRAVVEALGWCARVVIVSVALAFALNVVGVPLGTLIAPATVAGVAIGFGAQQVVGDLLAGFFLLAERQFGYGDVVRFSQPGAQDGVTGTVEELTLRVTKLRTADGNQVIIPNGALKQVTNLSKEWSRAVVDVPVGSDENLDRAGGIVEQAALAVA